MRYIEEYKGSYDVNSREEILKAIKRGRSRDSYTYFVLNDHKVKVIVDTDGLTFDVLDITEEVNVLIGNKLMIENDELFVDLLINYDTDRLTSFRQHSEKLAKYILDNMTREERDIILMAYFVNKIESKN